MLRCTLGEGREVRRFAPSANTEVLRCAQNDGLYRDGGFRRL